MSQKSETGQKGERLDLNKLPNGGKQAGLVFQERFSQISPLPFTRGAASVGEEKEKSHFKTDRRRAGVRKRTDRGLLGGEKISVPFCTHPYLRKSKGNLEDR